LAPNKQVRFHPHAELELDDAADWYEARRAGLGMQLVQAVREIVYREVGEDAVEIIAVAHLKRRPKYWANR